MMEQGGGNSPTVWAARTQSGDEQRRRAEADADAAAEHAAFVWPDDATQCAAFFTAKHAAFVSPVDAAQLAAIRSAE